MEAQAATGGAGRIRRCRRLGRRRGFAITSLDGNVATVTLTINAVNDAPVAQDGSASGDEDTTITGTVTASDVDGPSLTYAVVAQAGHGTVTLNQDGSFSYAPDGDYIGSDSFTFRANDGIARQQGRDRQPDDHRQRPAGRADGAASGDEDTTITGAMMASDVDSASLTAILVAQAGHGTVTLNPDGSFSYTPDGEYIGSDSFTFRVNDGSRDSNVATVNLTIMPSTTRPSHRTARRAETPAPPSMAPSWRPMSMARH